MKAVQQVLPPAAIDHEFEEMKWALNMTLVGDAHWNCMYSVEDIKNIVQRMERKVNFKVSFWNIAIHKLFINFFDTIILEIEMICESDELQSLPELKFMTLINSGSNRTETV